MRRCLPCEILPARMPCAISQGVISQGGVRLPISGQREAGVRNLSMKCIVSKF